MRRPACAVRTRGATCCAPRSPPSQIPALSRSRPVPTDVSAHCLDARQAHPRPVQTGRGELLQRARRAHGGCMAGARRRGSVKHIWFDLKQHPENALKIEDARSYSHPEGMEIRLQLANAGAEPWTVAGAVLKDSTGVEVEFSAWQQSAIAPDASGFVVVGTERDRGSLVAPVPSSCGRRKDRAPSPSETSRSRLQNKVRHASSAAPCGQRETQPTRWVLSTSPDLTT